MKDIFFRAKIIAGIVKAFDGLEEAKSGASQSKDEKIFLDLCDVQADLEVILKTLVLPE